MPHQQPPRSGPDTPLASAMDGVTWAVLLARWTEFAQGAIALPCEGEGDRWRQAVAPIIGLQAIAFALADLGSLRPEDRPLALERAEAGLRRHAKDLHTIWSREPLPATIAEIIADAQAALRLATTAGEEWRVAARDFVALDPTPIASSLIAGGFRGDLWAAIPGTRLAVGAPAAFVRAEAVREWPSCVGPHWSPHRQLYRQVDDTTSDVIRDYVAPIETGLPPGRPLLVQVINAGTLVTDFDSAQRHAWEESQRAAGVFDQPPPLSGGDTGGSDASG